MVTGTPKLASFSMLMPGLANPRDEVPAWWGDADAGGGWLGVITAGSLW